MFKIAYCCNHTSIRQSVLANMVWSFLKSVVINRYMRLLYNYNSKEHLAIYLLLSSNEKMLHNLIYLELNYKITDVVAEFPILRSLFK